MKPSRSLFSWLSLIALLTLALGCAGTKQTENQLALAGFKPVVASTARQQQQLRALPPGKVTRIRRNGKPYYVFPDVAHNQVYVGSPKEYRDYRQIHSDLQLSNDQFKESRLSQDSPDSYDDWGGWDVVVWSE